MQCFVLETLLGFTMFCIQDNEANTTNKRHNPDGTAEKHAPSAVQEYPPTGRPLELKITIYTNEAQ